MKFLNRLGQKFPSMLTQAAETAKTGTDVDRREFLAVATGLGASAATAYAMLGMAAPAQAAGHQQMGGTIRMQMEVRALKEPRTFDWTQIAMVMAG